jgi:hypothetical protein
MVISHVELFLPGPPKKVAVRPLIDSTNSQSLQEGSIRNSGPLITKVITSQRAGFPAPSPDLALSIARYDDWVSVIRANGVIGPWKCMCKWYKFEISQLLLIIIPIDKGACVQFSESLATSAYLFA